MSTEIPEDLQKQYDIALRNYSCVIANGQYVAMLIERIATLEAERVCSICGVKTDTACSDCRIDLRTTVYVCGKRKCMTEHENKCPHVLEAQNKRLREALEAILKRVALVSPYYEMARAALESK